MLPTPEELIAAGLWDPEAADADEQLHHLRLIAARGVSMADMQEAQDRGALDRLVAELLFLPPGPRYTAGELAARAGVDVGVVRELRRACGLPDVGDEERRFTEGDARVVAALDAGAALFGRPAALQLLRVIASSMGRVADAAVSTFVTTVGAASMSDDEALAAANAAAAALYDELQAVMDAVLRQHLVHLARPNMAAHAGFETRGCAVGFVDVVGSTSLGQRLPLDDVGRAIARFEAAAADVVTARGGRVIKFVGDEVMFRTDDLGAACAVGIELVDRIRDDPVLPGVRAGVAAGEVLIRDGDCFGPVVNLAARAVKAATAGAVVVASFGSVEREAGLKLLPLPAMELAGFEGPVAMAEVRRP